MTLITLKQFAKLKRVTIQAVRARKFETTEMYGKQLIDDQTEYKPRGLKGKRKGKPSKTKN